MLRQREDFRQFTESLGAECGRPPQASAGLNLLRDKEFVQAEKSLRECLAVREKAQPDEWTTFNSKAQLGARCWAKRSTPRRSHCVIAGCEGMLQLEAKISPPGKPRLTEALERLVELYEATSEPEKRLSGVGSWRLGGQRPSKPSRLRPKRRRPRECRHRSRLRPSMPRRQSQTRPHLSSTRASRNCPKANDFPCRTVLLLDRNGRA